MNKSNNVIELKSFKSKRTTTHKDAAEGQAPVVDMTARRNEVLTQERRKVRRTILSEFVGATVVVPEKGLAKVAIYDISETGIAFDIEPDGGHFNQDEEVAMRVYMNHETYFPFIVKVRHVKFVDDEGVFRHGATFVKGTINDQALHHFVKFIETVSASLETDAGDIVVSNLRF